MNTYYFYHSYHLTGKILGTLMCSLAWIIFGIGWWSCLLGIILLFLWLPVILRRPYFLSITSSAIFWGNSFSRQEIPLELIDQIGPNQEEEPGLTIELKNGCILDVERDCFDSMSLVRAAILKASDSHNFHIAPDLFAAPGLLNE